jgi:hypothetical protein
MSLVPIGELSLSAALPGGAAACAAGQTGINLALPDIQARLAALASFTPSPGNLPALIALAESIIAAIEAAIAAGIIPPSLSAQIAIIAALVADLEAAVLAVNMQLSIVVNLLGLLASAGIFAYAYDGRTDGLGPALTTELAGGLPGGSGGDHCNAIVLATSVGATWTAMSTWMKVTP